VINQSIDISKYLLDQGANVNALGSNGRTSLHLAVSSNNEELVTPLLEKGAD
jgi:ankyrin repeat protein